MRRILCSLLVAGLAALLTIELQLLGFADLGHMLLHEKKRLKGAIG
ncbi:hypothetical protein [Corticibacter populi]|nr:hypothetical protein [Corticibacter populi]